MFCVQCEQTIRTPVATGCSYAMGMCGKTSEVSDLQDMLVHLLQAVSTHAVAARHSVGLRASAFLPFVVSPVTVAFGLLLLLGVVAGQLIFRTARLPGVTSYLLGSDTPLPEPAPKPVTMDASHPGYGLYRDYCAGCHGQEGQGKPNVTPSMYTNATLDQASATNTLAVLLRGMPLRLGGMAAIVGGIAAGFAAEHWQARRAARWPR